MVSRRTPLSIDLRDTPATAHLPRRDGRWVRLGRWWFQPRTGAWVPVVAGGAALFLLAQELVRWRVDDGTEAAATWIGPEGNVGDYNDDGTRAYVSSTDASTPLDTNIRVRFTIEEIGGASGTVSPVLRYSKNAGAFTVVNGASTNVRSAASPHFADDDATTRQLTAQGGTFVAGRMDDSDGATTSISLSSGGYTEVEFCIQCRSADLVKGDWLELRVYNGTSALNATIASCFYYVGVGFRDMARGASNATTSTTIVVNTSVRTDDDLYVVFTSRNHTAGDADPTVTDNDVGGNTWTKVGQSSDKIANVFWKKATAATAGKTITVGGAINSLAAACMAVMGASSGDPTTNLATESNASGDETMAGITPSVAESRIVFAVFNYSNDIIDVLSPACTNPGALEHQLIRESSGGSNCAVNVAARTQVGGPTAAGNFTWTQTNGATWSAAWAVKPRVSTTYAGADGCGAF